MHGMTTSTSHLEVELLTYDEGEIHANSIEVKEFPIEAHDEAFACALDSITRTTEAVLWYVDSEGRHPLPPELIVHWRNFLSDRGEL
jgi:hypothetical protein